MRRIRKTSWAIYGALMAILRAAHAEDAWTDSLHGKEGVFALRAEPDRVLVIRADDRAGRNGSLRLRIVREAGAPLLVSLRRIDGLHAPWRYASEVAGWNGAALRIELEASDDGKSWRPVGAFRRD